MAAAYPDMSIKWETSIIFMLHIRNVSKAPAR